ncbi:hypothetical protein [Actinoallomurus sp. CA-150999]|uniref:hypothetical protein n=1 Tax=Actinoallomurus sp. CA-150999 TaxID=3239887 RepID=UPI003D8BD6C9
MSSPTFAVPKPEPPEARVHDPLAVAVGNASLLGVGYLMLGRRRLAVAAGVVTVVLFSVLVSVARPWFEVVMLLWWAAVIVHGWFLAGGRTNRVAVRRQRLVALGVTGSVLLVLGLLRFDATGIERSVADARADGDCTKVLTAQHKVWFGHRMADAPLTARGDKMAQACHRLHTARADLTAGLLTADPLRLKAGFGILAAVLSEPGNDRTVSAVLNGFLSGLPTNSHCRTASITDWLRHRRPSHNALDRSADTATQTAPAALVACGDDLMAAKDWTNARMRYQQLLDQFPGDERTAKAREGVTQATLKIELANVRRLLEGDTDEQPEYCSKPAKYSGAPPYGGGTNRALFYGNDHYTDKLPSSWRTTDPAHAVLVVCADDEDSGSAVETCPYRSRSSGTVSDVTFHKIAIPVKVYELRTGRLVAKRKVQIDGESCPSTISYSDFGGIDTGPPDQDVTPSKADVRDAFSPLIIR